MNIWYYVGSIAGIFFFILPVTGILALLFPRIAISFKNKFPRIYIFLFGIAVFAQLAAFWIVFGIGLKYVEDEGILGLLGGQAFLITPTLYLVVFLLSLYLQKRKNIVSRNLAFYISLTLSVPLYLLLMEILEKLLER